MSVINTNYLALVSQSHLQKSQSALGAAIERLSSGLRINSAKDDAAGFATAPARHALAQQNAHLDGGSAHGRGKRLQRGAAAHQGAFSGCTLQWQVQFQRAVIDLAQVKVKHPGAIFHHGR